ncbi:MAG: hypothetical protein ACW99A_12865 [Candidatus Kariarchaeaceae archaeon]|jgi:hypothetical protein
MKKSTAFSLILIILNLGTLLSQDTTKSTVSDFGITLGLNQFQIKEQILTNIRHSGFLGSFGLSYSWLELMSFKELKFNIIINMLSSRYETHQESIAANPSLHFRYIIKATNLKENLNLYLGGIAGWNLYMNHYEMWDESHIYWLNSYYIGLASRLSYQASEKSIINLDINIPIVALVSRPPERFLYKELNPEFSWFVSQFHKDLTLTSVHQHFELNMILEYKYGYYDKSKTSFFWHFTYVNNSIPNSQKIIILTNTFGVTFLL